MEQAGVEGREATEEGAESMDLKLLQWSNRRSVAQAVTRGCVHT